MKDFTRVAWASATAKATYGPKITPAAAAWTQAEVESVRAGLRGAALVFEPAHENSGLPARRVAEGRWALGPDADALAAAWADKDDDAVGRLLGFPACCRRFFAETWRQGALDTTAQMAANGGTDGPPECNILGRWLGLRWVTHLPCSFGCEASVTVGRGFRSIVAAEHAEVIDEVLSWAVEWSALHGVAEVRFPVLRVVTRTTYTPDEVVVRRAGRVPAGAPRGLRFPNLSAGAPLSLVPPPSYRDNGFATAEAQERAHSLVLGALAGRPPRGLTVDLGAGDGTLAEKIGARFGVPVAGIEAVRRKAATRPTIVRVGDAVAFASMFEGIDTLVISKQRFLENPGLEAACAAGARQCLAYSYDANPMMAEFL